MFSTLHYRLLFIIPIVLLVSVGCQPDHYRFQRLSSTTTGITFKNELIDTEELNILNYMHFYNGGGIAVGDVNNDSLPDLYFTANVKSNRLYINNGNFTFKDITEEAGVGGERDSWTSGATMADVNHDGWQDIYVSKVNFLNKTGANKLYINNRDGTFTDKAEEYGLDFRGYSVQACFFDYDNDSDLDMYLLNLTMPNTGNYSRKISARSTIHEQAGDRLFRNDGMQFTDVSEDAGIYSSVLGLGLGVTSSDINLDGCTDLFISNDQHENDYLYINQCDGTFREVFEETTGHTSRASMGNDIVDINNDLKPDIFILDMLPSKEEALKNNISDETYQVYKMQRDYGYQPQLIRNTLHLNRGEYNGIPKFSEIAYLSGVAATDWSWASLLFDMDNDGLRDIFVTNGIYRRPNEYRFLEFKRRNPNLSRMQKIQKMSTTKIPNVSFLNNGDLTFSHNSDDWGFNTPSYSNGAAYADLDNDGDQDLVINNVNQEAFVYRNQTVERDSSNYIKLKLHGAGENTLGIGSKILIDTGGKKILLEQSPTRGFQSSVDPILHSGLGNIGVIDTLTVIWPDQSYQSITQLKANQTIDLWQEEATGSFDYAQLKLNKKEVLLEEQNQQPTINFQHKENSYVDFKYEPLMPHMLSQEGPRIATGDVNNDGRSDLFIPGPRNQESILFIQQPDGIFSKKTGQPFIHDKNAEDVAATLFDANGDGNQDLYVASGGNEEVGNVSEMQDRLYLNDGNGNFIRNNDLLPELYPNASCVVPIDFDNDNDWDLFIGGRSVARNYGTSPKSYLLENNGKGQYKEVTNSAFPNGSTIGMITDAVATDIDNDQQTDLVMAGEWIPITIFKNQGGVFTQTYTDQFQKTNGWWNRLLVEDVDLDGDKDIIAGNQGTNTWFKPSEESPLLLYLTDFDGDGIKDPIISYTKNGNVYPAVGRDQLLNQMPSLKNDITTYGEYAGKTMPSPETLEKDQVKKIFTFESMYFENKEGITFEAHSLPIESQFAPVYAMHLEDLDGDDIKDLLIGGNMHQVQPVYGGRHDASYGLFLKGQPNQTFQPIGFEESGFFVEGEIRDIVKIENTNGQPLYIVTQNNGPIQVFTK